MEFISQETKKSCSKLRTLNRSVKVFLRFFFLKSLNWYRSNLNWILLMGRYFVVRFYRENSINFETKFQINRKLSGDRFDLIMWMSTHFVCSSRVLCVRAMKSCTQKDIHNREKWTSFQWNRTAVTQFIPLLIFVGWIV